jgi:tetratricopeptide (TPR) repeat protein
MNKKRPNNFVFPILIGLIALAVRLWNTISIGNNFYANFLSDASTYRVWATKIAAGSSYGEPVYQMGPLCPYFLALNLNLGIGFFSVLFVQAFLGAFVCVIVYCLANKLYGEQAALISGLLAALYAPFIFYDGLILSESIQVFLFSISLLFLFWDGKRLKPYRELIAGIFIGLTALGRATIMFFPMALIAYWVLRQLVKKDSLKKKAIVRSAFLIAGLVAGIMPATLHNMSYDDFVAISSNTGINFYVGNNVNSDGTYNEPPGLDLSSDFTGRQVAEREAGHNLKSSEVSSFWMSKSLSDIKGNPGHFIGGLINKVWLYLWYFDIPQAESIQIQKEFSPIFHLPLAGFGLALVLGVIGLVFNTSDNRRWLLILLFIANLFGVALFFVIGRFRLLGAVGLLIPSGAGALAILAELKVRNTRKLITYGATIFGIVLLLFLPRPVNVTEKLASAYDNVGIYYYYTKQPDVAIKWYRKASQVLPAYSASLNNIGTYFYGKAQLDSSKYYFHCSLEIDPGEDKTLMNLGRIALDQNKLDTAEYYFKKAKEAAPFGTAADAALKELDRKVSGTMGKSNDEIYESFFKMAETFSGRNQFAEAEKFYNEALKIKPDDIKAMNNLGFACQAQKNFDLAASCFDKVIRLSPDNGIAYNNLAGTVYQMGLLDSAITLWEKASKLDPSNTQIKTNLEFVKKNRK